MFDTFHLLFAVDPFLVFIAGDVLRCFSGIY